MGCNQGHWNPMISRTMLSNFSRGSQREKVTDADVDRSRTFLCRKNSSYCFSFKHKNLLASDIFGFTDQSTFCHSNRWLAYCKAQVTRETTTIRMCHTMTID